MRNTFKILVRKAKDKGILEISELRREVVD
jgi:hypothetical protein